MYVVSVVLIVGTILTLKTYLFTLSKREKQENHFIYLLINEAREGIMS